MRGVIFNGDCDVEIREFPDPSPGPDDVVLEMKASGMCGSDLHQYRRKKGDGAAATGLPVNLEPVIVGHEPAGVIVAVGAAVDPSLTNTSTFVHRVSYLIIVHSTRCTVDYAPASVEQSSDLCVFNTQFQQYDQ